MTKVISGFPGVGKSTLFASGAKCSDSDSSKFDKAHFPGNYIEHIKGLLAKGELDYIFVSSHDNVRAALVSEGIEFTLVYPNISLKEEYLKRYAERGSPQPFLDLMERSWGNFVLGCAEQSGCNRVVLQEGQFLADVIAAV